MGENEDLVRQLAEALKPFADAYAELGAISPFDFRAWRESGGGIKLEHLRQASFAYARAEAALSAV